MYRLPRRLPRIQALHSSARTLAWMDAQKPKALELVYEAPLATRMKAIALTASATNAITCVGIPLAYTLGQFPIATPGQMAIYGTLTGLGVLSTTLLRALFKPYVTRMWMSEATKEVAIETVTVLGAKELSEFKATDISRNTTTWHPMINYTTLQKPLFLHKEGAALLDELLSPRPLDRNLDPRHRKDKKSDANPMQFGKRLTLRFDPTGRMTHEDYSRHDVLKMVQKAAVPASTWVGSLPSVVSLTVFKSDTPEYRAHAQTRIPRGPKGIVDIPNIHMRDIRKLDNAFALASKPSITVRRGAILLNADPVRAIIMQNNCVVFLQEGAESVIPLLEANFKEFDSQDHAFEFTFERRLRASELTGYCRALESLLLTICTILEKDCTRVLPLAQATIDKMTQDAALAGELETLRSMKNQLDELNARVTGTRKAFVDILENEEDLRMMHLTKLHDDPALVRDLFSFDSEELESLLEVYLEDIYDTQTRVALMLENMANTKNIAMLKLDAKRNYLMTLNLTLTLWTTLVSVPTFIVGAFGMNLASNLEEVQYLFYLVGGSAMVFPIGAYRYALRYLNQRGIALSWRN
ncbi:CorA Metal Ion Transporter (MIT) Family [Achlya hypogyna]|uniref:Magnesium transporter n=1 Tax=Achlya hypogyna TaxID=1202772 RepID=A0A1V9YX56_ACHHY|nr:CorA Metal Ion Transporter (MIT) Family [Achlya hypogyna]